MRIKGLWVEDKQRHTTSNQHVGLGVIEGESCTMEPRVSRRERRPSWKVREAKRVASAARREAEHERQRRRAVQAQRRRFRREMQAEEPNEPVERSKKTREVDPQVALRAMYERTGVHRSLEHELRDVEGAEPHKLCEAFEKVLSGDQALSTCCSCGIYGLASDLAPLSDEAFERLEIPSEELDAMHARIALRGATCEHVQEIDGKWYRCVGAPQDDGTWQACTACAVWLKEELSELPRRALACADWGLVPSDLPKLSLLEQVAISQVVTVARVVKLVPCSRTRLVGTERMALKGHIVSFPHDASERLLEINELPRADFAAHVTVVWVGPHGEQVQRVVMKNAELDGVFSINVQKCLAWLRFLRKASPHYAGWLEPEDAAAVQDEMSIAAEGLLRNVAVADDVVSTSVEAMSCADSTYQRAGNCIHEVMICGPTAHGANDARILEHLDATLHPPDSGSNQTGAAHDHGSGSLQATVDTMAPLNEFAENRELLGKAFPFLFPCGVPRKVTASVVKQLLLFHDRRFAQCSVFVFLMFNQMQRWQAASRVNMVVDGGDNAARAFVECVNAPEFDTKLKAAMEDPTSSSAKEVLSSVSPLMRRCASAVPWSGMERKNAMNQLFAMMHMFGDVSFFNTMSPSMVDVPLALRLSLYEKGIAVRGRGRNRREWEKVFPPLSERAALVSQNPVMEAKVFKRMVDAVNAILLRSPSTDTVRTTTGLKKKQQGVFGKVTGHFGVVEAQRNGAPHHHQVAWGGIAPRKVQASVAQEPAVRDRVCNALDLMIRGELPDSIHDSRMRRKLLVHDQRVRRCKGEAMPQSLPPQPRAGLKRPFSETRGVDLGAYAGEIGGRVSVHQHTATCRKPPDESRCRLAVKRRRMKRTRFTELSVDEEGRMQSTIQLSAPPTRSAPYRVDPLPPEDPRILVVDIVRSTEADQYVIEFNDAFLASLKCNVNNAYCGSSVSSKAVLFYLLKYLSKNPTELSSSLSLIYAARKQMLQYPSVAEDSGSTPRNAKHLLAKLTNQLTGMQEYSAPVAALALLGAKSFTCSDPFWYCFIWPAVKFMVSKVDNFGAGGEDDALQDLEKDLEEDTAACGDALHVFGNDSMSGGTEIKRDADGKIVAVDQYVHYRWRGKELGDLNFYEYCALIIVSEKEKLEGMSDEGSEGNEQGNNAPGPVQGTAQQPAARQAGKRQKNGRFEFLEAHPLHETHIQRLRSKIAVPVLAGKPRPLYVRPDPNAPEAWQEKRQKRNLAWMSYMATLLVPWDPDSGLVPPDARYWDGFCHLLERWARGRGASRPVVAKGRYAVLCNVTEGFRLPPGAKEIVSRWRFEHADKLTGVATSPAAEDDMGDVVVEHAGATADDTEEAREAIMALRQLAEADSAGLTGNKDDVLERQYLDRMEREYTRMYDRTTVAPAQDSNGRDSTETQDTGSALCSYANWVHRTIEWAEEERDALMAGSREDSVEADDEEAEEVPERDSRIPSSIFEFPRNLNAGQRAALETVDTILRSGKQLLLLIHGGPGTGKTHLAHAVMRCMEAHTRQKAIFCATTGVAASHQKGCTVHSLFRLPVMKVSRGMSAGAMDSVRSALEPCCGVVIDEISMLDACTLANVEKNATAALGAHPQKLPFSGKHLVLMGDFHQLSPVKGEALHKSLVAHSKFNPGRKQRSVAHNTLHIHGVNLFSRFVRVNLTEQMRAGGDPQHTEFIEKLRQEEHPISFPMLRRLRPIQAADMDANPDWQFATIVVSSNAERSRLNKWQLTAFARARQEPIFTWLCPIKLGSSYRIANGVAQEVLEAKCPELRAFFVRGAPAVITCNVCPEYGIANGTRGVFESLVWSDPSTMAFAASCQGRVAEVIQVDQPSYVVVRAAGHSVPIRRVQDRTKAVKINDQRRQFDFRSSGCEIGFASTFHKIQGATLDKVVLCLNARRSKKLMTVNLQALYVGLTRVRSGDGLRIWPSARGDLDYLLKLKRPSELSEWENGYNEYGRWAWSSQRNRESVRALCAAGNLAQLQRPQLVEWAREISVPFARRSATQLRRDLGQYKSWGLRNRAIEIWGRKFQDVPGDGNCGFTAVGLQMGGLDADGVRQLVVATLNDPVHQAVVAIGDDPSNDGSGPSELGLQRVAACRQAVQSGIGKAMISESEWFTDVCCRAVSVATSRRLVVCSLEDGALDLYTSNGSHQRVETVESPSANDIVLLHRANHFSAAVVVGE